MFNTKPIKQIKRELNMRRWRILVATIKHLLTLFKRIDASSSVLAMMSVGLVVHSIA